MIEVLTPKPTVDVFAAGYRPVGITPRTALDAPADAQPTGVTVMATSGYERYPEKRLQLAAIEWLKTHQCYVESFSDVEAVGARIDSVGQMNGRLTLIEVKPSISATIVNHHADRAHSIEAKVAGVLGPLYRREAAPLAEQANRLWDRRAAPLVAILVGSISGEGMTALCAMLAKRAADWMFDAAIWQWTGDQVRVLWSCECAIEPAAIYDRVEVPRMIGRTPRAANLTLAELELLADERGVGCLFRHFLAAVRSSGWKIKTGRACLRVRASPALKPPQTILAVYLDGEELRALNVGCWRELLGIKLEELPGSDAPARFLNTNRLLTSSKEIDELIDLVVGRLDGAAQPMANSPTRPP